MDAYLPPTWVVWIVGGVCALTATWILARAAVNAARAARRARKPRTTVKRHAPEDWLTWVMAGIATSVSAQGMWKFFADVLGVDGPMRVLGFAFIEGAIVISALRARKSMRDNYSAGVDGVAVWALACLTAALSAIDARNFGEVVFRLAAPLVAAWLWERGMRLERRRVTGLSGIHWRITPERALVWLGLAEAKDRSASEVDAHRRLTRVALAAKKARALRDQGVSDRKLRAAMAKLDRALDKAVEHTGLPRDERMQWALLDQITALYGGASLLDLPEVAPWAHIDHPAVTGAAKHHEAVKLADAMREWTTAIQAQRDPETQAAIQSMAAYIARLEGRELPSIETPGETVRGVEVEVSPGDIDELIDRLRDTPPQDAAETGDETANETRATDAMWRRWQEIVEVERRIPNGAELAAAGRCSPQWGAKKARQWLAEMDGRTRRALESKRRAEA
jgi:hypothetical protein